MFNPKRLILARKRCKLTAKRLAEMAQISAVTLTRIEKEIQDPEDSTIQKLADALGYPVEFFSLEDADEFTQEAADAVNFRSLSKMTVRERDAALSAGTLAFEFSDWVSERFNMPEPDLPDLGLERHDPEIAAKCLRNHWGLGEAPVSNIIKLFESKGIKVFSLSENTQSVDAFSCWRNDTPFVFLNTIKTAERSRFDAAHEVAHLVLHRHGLAENSKEAESEADRFASAFLMPSDDVRARLPVISSVDNILQAKLRWRVSAFALAYRLHKLGVLSDWRYRSVCIELGRRGYRSGEPQGIERETSFIWKKVFEELWRERVTREDIAAELCLPLEEINSMVFGLITEPDDRKVAENPAKNGGLRVVK